MHSVKTSNKRNERKIGWKCAANVAKPVMRRGQYPIKLETDCCDCHQLCEWHSHWGNTRWQCVACCIVAHLLTALLHVACFGSLTCHQAERVRQLPDDCLFESGPNKYADSRASPLTVWQQILLPLQARTSACPSGTLTFYMRLA